MTFFTGYAGLGTGSNSFTEQTGTGYARQAITLAPVVAGFNRHQTNTSSLTFTAGGTWDVSTQMGVFATATSANPLVWWNKANPVAALTSAQTFVVNANQLNLFFSDDVAAAGSQTAWVSGDVIGSTAANETLTVGAPVLVDDDTLSVGFPLGCVAHLIGANANATTDQQFVLNPLLNGGNFIVTKIIATNASVSLTTAAGGVYPAASKGGTALVASSQVYTTLTSSALYMSLTLAATTNTAVYSTAPYFSLTTAQGAAATVDLYIVGQQIF